MEKCKKDKFGKLLCMGSKEIDNLILTIDVNKQQFKAEDVMSLGNLNKKYLHSIGMVKLIMETILKVFTMVL